MEPVQERQRPDQVPSWPVLYPVWVSFLMPREATTPPQNPACATSPHSHQPPSFSCPEAGLLLPRPPKNSTIAGTRWMQTSPPMASHWTQKDSNLSQAHEVPAGSGPPTSLTLFAAAARSSLLGRCPLPWNGPAPIRHGDLTHTSVTPAQTRLSPRPPPTACSRTE